MQREHYRQLGQHLDFIHIHHFLPLALICKPLSHLWWKNKNKKLIFWYFNTRMRRPWEEEIPYYEHTLTFCFLQNFVIVAQSLSWLFATPWTSAWCQCLTSSHLWTHNVKCPEGRGWDSDTGEQGLNLESLMFCKQLYLHLPQLWRKPRRFRDTAVSLMS